MRRKNTTDTNNAHSATETASVLPFGSLPTTPQQDAVPFVFARLSPAVPTPIFGTYWKFATERQEIFFRRFRNEPPPWTSDPILRRHKFTNAYRASDRVSQFLIRHVIYEASDEPREVFFRTILFKLFNRIETWRLLQREVSLSTRDFDVANYDQVLTKALAAGDRIYSAAYIMPTGGRGVTLRKHRAHLELLAAMLHDDVPERLQEARSMRSCFELLRSYPMMGDFLSYQFVIDLNYSTLLNFTEMEFVVPGPGARGGIRKCFSSFGGLSEPDLIKMVTEQQKLHFEHLDLTFKSLWGRPLQLIDCQNLFCEVDKYARQAHPEANGTGGRHRIKQLFRPLSEPVSYWYPPKWGLNSKIEQEMEGRNAYVCSR